MEVRYEGSHDDPYAAPYGAMPPPTSLDAGLRRGKNGHFGPYAEEPPRGSAPGGLIVSCIPPHLNTLDALNRHFRQFGEVLKITVQANEARASVQFSDRSAAEAATTVPVFDRPEIMLAWAPKTSKGRGKVGGRNRNDVQHDKPAENRVLVADPGEQKRIDESKKKRDELTARKTQLLGNLTEQMKAIMTKLNDREITEEKREALRALMKTITEKMEALNGVPEKSSSSSSSTVRSVIVDDPPPRPAPPAVTPKGKGSPTTWHTLDLRPKVLRVNLVQGWTVERLRDELKKFSAGDEQIRDISHAVDSGGQPNLGAALVQFKDRWSAEQLFNQRSELPFYAEWCDQLPPSPAALPAADPPQEVPEDQPLVEQASTEALDPDAAVTTCDPVATAATPQEVADESAAADVTDGAVPHGDTNSSAVSVNAENSATAVESMWAVDLSDEEA